MVLQRLGPEHKIAIEYLAMPNRGGKSLEEIAKEAGVTRKTLYNWRNDPVFAAEYKKHVIRNTQDRLPEMVESMVDAVIEDRNGTMAKLVLQMNDMLTDKVSVEQKLDGATDIESMEQRIAAYKQRNNG